MCNPVWISRAAFALTFLASLISAFRPEWAQAGIALALLSALLLWTMRELAQRANAKLIAQVLELGGSVDGLDIAIRDAHPNLNNSAGFVGEGELARMNYAQLIRRLRTDGHLGALADS
ncbi:hypothetical protein [Alteriqipengyuania lutimaris]|uniref:Uncharacterized protein n=1 Tax=Alteriqipengyuania lutimaris TaxID=1538146 RepID=A0A395LHT8_9SPHN|nr:hypothetical protein [Alteriqipengyuania lutimaris]MBB3034745.1 hypothetical protein [Alteriqipengyuania lutimaris]RDS76402.1 hypothetical protein DL238_01445 [Alteriqipengyuania lutimaris]